MASKIQVKNREISGEKIEELFNLWEMLLRDSPEVASKIAFSVDNGNISRERDYYLGIENATVLLFNGINYAPDEEKEFTAYIAAYAIWQLRRL